MIAGGKWGYNPLIDIEWCAVFQDLKMVGSVFYWWRGGGECHRCGEILGRGKLPCPLQEDGVFHLLDSPAALLGLSMF